MAIFVKFKKVRETETEVAYRYGHSEDDLPSELTISKANPKGPPVAGPDDPVTQWVIARALYRYSQTQTWPEGGVIQN
jgi:hypothetical protein